MSDDNNIRIYYANRLNRSYFGPMNLNISLNNTIQNFIIKIKEFARDKSYIDIDNPSINININNTKITQKNILHELKTIVLEDIQRINITINNIISRDIDGYINMKNLLEYLSTTSESLNIVSTWSYNQQHISSNIDINIDINIDRHIVNKNILQQTQYTHLNDNFQNINIVLFDLSFFTDNSNIEQIYNLVDIIETPITEFNVENFNKIKKFIKPADTKFKINPRTHIPKIAKIYVDALNKFLNNIISLQITWYILNYRTVVEKDEISQILQDINCQPDIIQIYQWMG